MEQERSTTTVEIDALPVAVVTFDLETGTVRSCNRAAIRLLGNEGPIEGADIRTLLRCGPTTPLGALSTSVRLLHTGSARKAIRVRPSSQMTDADEGLVIIEELTAHEAILDDFDRLETSFRALAEQVPGALFRYILYPDGSDAVTFMSSGCLELWEVGPEAIRDDATILWQMVDKDDLPAMQDSVMSSARTLQAWSHEWRITTPSGKRKWLRAKGRPRQRSDGTVEWDSLIMDVSEDVRQVQLNQQLEAQLQQATRMESIGRLAGGVAHDFNNMLTVITSSVEIASLTLPGARDNQHLNAIRMAAERSAELTTKLLTFSRSRSTEPKSIQLHDHLSQLLPLLNRMAGDAVVVRISDDSKPCWVHIDGTELDQLITNLVTNARDAMRSTPGVHITLNCGPDPDDSHWTCIRVDDEGLGIDPAIAGHIFEPYYTTKDGNQHSGLGLATVYGIVQGAGGTIEALNLSSGGARFIVKIPAGSDETRTPTPDDSTKSMIASMPDHHGLQILIVDDDPHVRLVLARLVRSLGYRSVEVGSGEEALEVLSQTASEFALALIDLSMPRMDGRELAERVASRHPAIAIILMSGFIVADAAPQLAPDAPILEKPFSRDELRNALRIVLNGRREAS